MLEPYIHKYQPMRKAKGSGDGAPDTTLGFPFVYFLLLSKPKQADIIVSEINPRTRELKLNEWSAKSKEAKMRQCPQTPAPPMGVLLETLSTDSSSS